MNLNIFETLKNEAKSNNEIENFIKETGKILENNQENYVEPEKLEYIENNKDTDLQQDRNELEQYRKEGHLYLVTEDRDGKIFLWDMTDRPKNEIEEIDFPQELINKATEGSIFKYNNGTYEFYSEDGYDILFNNEA